MVATLSLVKPLLKGNDYISRLYITLVTQHFSCLATHPHCYPCVCRKHQPKILIMAEPSCMVSGPDLEDPTSPYEEELEERRAAKEDQEAQHNSSVPKEGNTALERKKTNTYYSKHHRGWRHLVRNFTPSWFAVTMGTGISSILLHQLPYNAHWLHIISYIVFCLNIFLFVTFFFISLLRYTLCTIQTLFTTAHELYANTQTRSSNMECNDQTSPAELVPWYFSHGFSNHC